MRFRPKTRRRLLLLAVVALFLFTAAVGLIVVRKWQNNRRIDQFRTVGMQMLQEQNYPEVIDNLGRYLRRRSDDRDAWLAYAKARELIEAANGSHLAQAISAYQKALALDDSDRATAVKVKLVHLYNEVGYFNEARDLAVKLRQAATAPDPDVLREEAAARIGLKAFDDNLDKVTDMLAALDPGGYRSTLLRVTYLSETKQVPKALEFVAARPRLDADDTRFDVLGAMIRAQATPGKDTADALIAAACKAAALEDADSAKPVGVPTYTETEFAFQLVSLFDSLKKFPHSLAVLRDGSERLKSADFKRLYVRRLWQAGGNAELMTYLASLDLSEKGDHSELLAFRALAAHSAGKTDDAKAMLEALRARKRDFRATAWVSVLDSLFDQKDLRASLKLVDAAIKENASEPVFTVLRAEYLAGLGRADEARAAWKSAYDSRLAAGWALPAVRISQTLLAEGRLDEASRAATEAKGVNPAAFDAAYAEFQAQTAILESGRLVSNPAAMLEGLDKTQTQIEKLQDPAVVRSLTASLVPGRAILLSQLGKLDEARDAIRAALRTDPPPDPDIVRRLAIASARAKLGLEEECFAAISKADAPSDPQMALTRAILLFRSGKRDEALALMEPAGTPTDEQRRNWRLARAQYMDAVGHQDALSAWREVSDAYPETLSIQSATLRSEAAAQDPALIDKVVSRVVSLGGSDPDRPSVDVRLARANALLHSPPAPRTRDEAVSILRGLLIEVPDMIRVRELLISGLLMDVPDKDVRPDTPAAIEQLTAAAAVAADRAPFTLQLARILTSQGRSTEAASELSKLALDPTVTEQARLAAIDMLIQQRELEPARVALEALIARAGADPPVTLLVRHATTLFTLRRDREALAAYQRLATRNLDDPNITVEVASKLRALGDDQAAARVISALAADATPDKRRYFALARYAELASNKPEALRLYELATTSFPSDPEVWSRLARFHLSGADFPAAVAAAKRGLEHVPDDPDLLVVLQQATVAQSGAADPDLTALAEALAKSPDPATAQRGKALQELQRLRKEGKIDDANELVSTADKFATDQATQLFVGRRLLEPGPQQDLTHSAAIAQRAFAQFPTDPEVARLAVDVAAARADWPAMLQAAEAWRQLTRSPEADIAAAEAQLALNLPRQASDLVRAFKLPDPITDADRVALGILNVRVRASVMLGDRDAAFRLLEKPIAQSSAVRTAIALPVASTLLPDAKEVVRWIDVIAAKTDPQSVPEQLAVARAWAGASERFPKERPELLDRAIAACRAALAKDDKSVDALIDLARMLLARPGDPSESADLAHRAGELVPSSAVPTLIEAQAFLKLSELRDAAGRDAARATAQQLLEKLKVLPVSSPDLLADIALLAEGLDDLPSAISFYERVVALPQTLSGMGLAATKNNLAFALFQRANGPSAPADLARARTLAEEAVKIAEIAPFYETLGSITAALGDRPAAIVAYRRAISLDEKSMAATIGLADLFSQGNASEKQEAAQLVGRIDDMLKAGASMSDLRRKQFDQVKSRLAPR